MKRISVADIVQAKGKAFGLEVIYEGANAKLPVTVGEVNRPGLALAGFTDNFLFERIQILGETETLYLNTLSDADRGKAIAHLFDRDVPCLIVSKGLPIDTHILKRCQEREVPLLRTSMSTTPFIHVLTAHLNNVFAPTTTRHGSLVDVYGIGLLFSGESGIGKSETALDLVERGHRLVADDVVIISRRPPNILVGNANELVGHRMEIRGIGIIDIREMFGIRATRVRKRVEVEVRLVQWDPDAPYERLGLEERTSSVLGCRLPYVTIPLVPGKNVSALAEVVAMNHLIKQSGGNPAVELDVRLKQLMSQDRSASPIGELGDSE